MAISDLTSGLFRPPARADSGLIRSMISLPILRALIRSCMLFKLPARETKSMTLGQRRTEPKRDKTLARVLRRDLSPTPRLLYMRRSIAESL